MIHRPITSLLCPDCVQVAVRTLADSPTRSGRIELLPGGWGLLVPLSGVPTITRCRCGADAVVEDFRVRGAWCTDCWVAEQCQRDAEAESQNAASACRSTPHLLLERLVTSR